MKKIFLIVPVLLLVFALVAGCGGGSQGAKSTSSGGAQAAPKQIKVASDIAYRPFEFTKNGKPVGFDIDLMRAIGKKAGFTPQFQNVTFDGIIPGLGNNLYDAAISAMTITPQREKSVDFSKPYFNSDQSLMVRKGSKITSIDNIGNATVGVQLGTTGAIEAKKFKKQGKIKGNIRTFDTITDAFNALENGQIQAIINDFPVSAYRAKTSGGKLKVVQTFPTGEQYGIAFPKGSKLRPKVDKALAEIKKDGTYTKIYEKWFGQKPKRIP
ncbi:MAG: basic amino acid ABC transporter substrate-binding protein [Rubrobacteraceae bacterium]|uniref:basic amino acid ABC transporter substrate-binding protein n=1 Tax=Rubrobacter naiadicus TaxID=1392641 RepID=UPI002360DE51|nr:basic amino acid ABC transporter substrate-binding protein [Rubrobacter naiadicus]MBX6764178.1 basic amino acid ABC transporter substrate-binding protein [Rubrobacteraceae bacterium]MCL6439432.1 basic amino acid ABC transporter substrate-binding protein [Rubrobacteraceae bacterium]